MRPECEQHYTPARDNQYRATARYYKDSCPYCEISRLKAELSEAYTELAISIKERIDLGNQLAEARAEIEIEKSNHANTKHCLSMLRKETKDLERYRTGIQMEGEIVFGWGKPRIKLSTDDLYESDYFNKHNPKVIRVLITELEG